MVTGPSNMKKELKITDIQDMINDNVDGVDRIVYQLNCLSHNPTNEPLSFVLYELQTILKTQTLILAHLVAVEERLSAIEVDKHTHPEFHGN